jgi:hypothetical protein
VQGARACPGNFHYYVHYLKPGEKLDEEKRRAVRLANFKVYNLVTLFLNDEGILALGELIETGNCPENHFCDYANEHTIPVQFQYYVTGALGAGKSTAINYFRNLIVLDEWLEQRLEILSKDWATLTPEEKNTVDQWIARQFKLKNDLLRNAREGIFVMDRGPLDPIAFTPEAEWNDKANRLLSTICPGHASWNVEEGQVIFLEGDSSELALRMVITQRPEYTEDKLKIMEEKLGKAYGDSVIRINTRGLTPSDVAKRVAEIIHLETHSKCNLHKRLENIKKDGSNVAP